MKTSTNLIVSRVISNAIIKVKLNFVFNLISKHLSFGSVSHGGRNFKGRICVYHRGGGKKKKFRFIDRFRRLNQVGSVIRIYKVSHISAFIGTIIYNNGLSSYIILSDNVSVGSLVFSGAFMDLKHKKINFFSSGSTALLQKISLFSQISSIELLPAGGSVLARAAGTSAFLTGRETVDKVWLKLSSGWHILISSSCLASLGAVSNPKHVFTRIRKAGLVRIRGFRPKVRGVAMNPCDHPHGGGEGKGSPPVAQVSPWGRLTKGTPTNNKKKDRLLRRLYKII
jgi:large subunit ribosomal protein L2